MDPLRAITVFTTLDGRPCNKIVTRRPDGGIDKARAKSGRYTARTVPVPTLADLACQLRSVAARPDQMISLSLFVDPPADEWQVWACWELAERLGVDKNDRDALAGFHWIDGVWVVARIKQSMRLGGHLLFDRDMSDGMPPMLAELETPDWRRATALLFPGADTCGCVILPSTSNRIIIDGVGGTSRSCHMIVAVDPSLIEGAWDQACHRSLITSFAPTPWDDEIGLAFAKPVYERKNGTGVILRHSWWTIFDRSTWAVGREVFDGAPVSQAAGVVIGPPEVLLFEGPPLDLSLVKDLTKPELAMMVDVIRGITGVRPTINAERTTGADGRSRITSLSIVVPDLDLDLDIESENGWTTVRALQDSGADHARLQSPFRESYSWAAFYGVHGDGTPFVFDMGTSERHVLAREGLKHIWQHICDWLRAEYRPAFRCPEGAMFSETHGRKLTMREVRPTPAILRLLRLASNTPINVKGLGVKENALPTEFSKWLPFGWSACLQDLPLEVDAGVNEAAGDVFKAQLERLFKAHVQNDSGGRWLKRALGTWCHYHATLAAPGGGVDAGWQQVGTLDAWGRILSDGAFQLALTHNLASQVSRTNHPELVLLDRKMLTKLCRRYGILANVGDNRVYVGRTQVRMTVLTTEFVASLELSYDHDDPQGAALRAGLYGDPGKERTH